LRARAAISDHFTSPVIALAGGTAAPINRYHETSSSGEYAFGHGLSWIMSSELRSIRPRAAREGGMNHSMYGADRATHLKIVVIGLVCALLVAAIGIFAHVSSNIDLGTAALVKAGRPTSLGGDIPSIR
jgi:hypothetical protein